MTITVRPCLNAGWYYVPVELIGGRAAIEQEKVRLTWRSRAKKGEPPSVIRMFKDLPSEGYLGVPRAYGQARYGHFPSIDQRIDGLPMIDPVVRLPDPNHPSVKEPERQARFMHEMETATRETGNFIAYAPTGSGKTVVGARNAAIFGRKTAILVPLERLLEQWAKELMDKLGVPEHRIGLVQSDTCDWQDRDYVLCMMKSLSMRRYPTEFYQSIGHVLVDECHRIATPELAMTVGHFPARIRIGLSATPEKKNGSDRVIYWHLGQVEVKSQATALDCDVYVRVMNAEWMSDIKSTEDGFLFKCLSRWEYRNDTLANDIVRLWRAGRNVLALSHHVAHVQDIMRRVVAKGIPLDQIGQCTGTRHIERMVMKGGKLKYEKVREEKIGSREFNHAKENSRVVFATYGVFKEGIDEPRLDAGIELMPPYGWTQAGGRVRRVYPGKTKALWITYRDAGHWRFQQLFESNLRDMNASAGVRVIYGRL